MGKYEPLGEFLRRQRAEEVHMTFADIERVDWRKASAQFSELSGLVEQQSNQQCDDQGLAGGGVSD